MVGYDDNADALTLGDDDVLTVGDYEISYDSGANEWQAEYTPSGDVASVPKNQSGSLFPTDFADALAGQALADDGNLYSSVDTAVNNATNWVFVGPGTFNESITISTAGLTLTGAGYDSVIDGGSSDTITTTADNITIQNIRVSASNRTIAENGSANTVVENVFADGRVEVGTDGTVSNCNFTGAVYAVAQRVIITGNNIDVVGRAIIAQNDDCVISDNVVVADGTDTGSANDHGIWLNGADDSVVIGNRIHNFDDIGILIQSNDTIIANNRISDCNLANLDDQGTGTVLDGNLTGASN